MASRRAAADSEGGEEGIEVMTDADFEQAMEALRDEGSEDVGELLSKWKRKVQLSFYDKMIEMIKNCLITDHLGIIFMLQSIV